MGLYRRFARSKKGMSTIFGALFFVILILMGFNVMLWGFVQLDAYNSVITKMSQRDQQAVSENIVPTNSTCDSKRISLQRQRHWHMPADSLCPQPCFRNW